MCVCGCERESGCVTVVCRGGWKCVWVFRVCQHVAKYMHNIYIFDSVCQCVTSSMSQHLTTCISYGSVKQSVTVCGNVRDGQLCDIECVTI